MGYYQANPPGIMSTSCFGSSEEFYVASLKAISRNMSKNCSICAAPGPELACDRLSDTPCQACMCPDCQAKPNKSKRRKDGNSKEQCPKCVDPLTGKEYFQEFMVCASCFDIHG